MVQFILLLSQGSHCVIFFNLSRTISFICILVSSDLGTGSRVFLSDKNTNLDKTLYNTQHLPPPLTNKLHWLVYLLWRQMQFLQFQAGLTEQFIRRSTGTHHHSLVYEVTEVNWVGSNLAVYVWSIMQKIKPTAEHHVSPTPPALDTTYLSPSYFPGFGFNCKPIQLQYSWSALLQLNADIYTSCLSIDTARCLRTCVQLLSAITGEW